jgi:hypothetical protein
MCLQVRKRKDKKKRSRPDQDGAQEVGNQATTQQEVPEQLLDVEREPNNDKRTSREERKKKKQKKKEEEQKELMKAGQKWVHKE